MKANYNKPGNDAFNNSQLVPEKEHLVVQQRLSTIALSDWLKSGHGRQHDIVTKLIESM